MGCDIHVYTEFKHDGAWHSADHWEPSKWDAGELTIPWRFRCYHDRNYSFFSFLANVRNSTWGNQVPVLQEPRGLPEDISDPVRKEMEDGGYHSPSYFTLAELRSGWKSLHKETVVFDAVVHAGEAEVDSWLILPEETRGSPPGGYCASSNSPRAINAKWHETMEELIGPAFHKVTRFLSDLTMDKNCKDDEVRIVFGFDS